MTRTEVRYAKHFDAIYLRNIHKIVLRYVVDRCDIHVRLPSVGHGRGRLVAAQTINIFCQVTLAG